MAKRLISSENYVIPVILAVAVEVLVLVGLFFSWSSTPDIPPAKPVMVATLYELNSKSPATKQSTEKFAGESEKTKAKTTQEDQLASQIEAQKKVAEAKAKEQAEAKKAAEAKAKTEAEAKKKAEAQAKANEAKKIADAKAEAKKKAEEKAKAEAKKKAEAAQKAKEAKEAAALTDLLGDKVVREETNGDQTGSQVVGKIDDLIRQRVQQNWTELGNPVPGTKVTLSIEMLPDGTITNVSVTQSSGNVPFDNSAVTAVRNIGKIPEVKQLDLNTFNQLYRKRAFIFTAKGL